MSGSQPDILFLYVEFYDDHEEEDDNLLTQIISVYLLRVNAVKKLTKLIII